MADHGHLGTMVESITHTDRARTPGACTGSGNSPAAELRPLLPRHICAAQTYGTLLWLQ